MLNKFNIQVINLSFFENELFELRTWCIIHSMQDFL